MSEIRVRRAMLQDEGSFRTLWQRFTEQQFNEGSLILPNEHNLNSSTRMFHSYVSGQALGLVLFACDGVKDIGVWMEGVPGDLELSIGPYTMLWGLYYDPQYRGQGITHKLTEVSMEWTHKQGFTGGITGVLIGDKTIQEVIAQSVIKIPGASKSRPYTVEMCWEFGKEG